MEELDLRSNLTTVKAPPGFERMVLARLHETRSEKRPALARSVKLRLGLAGGLAALLACFVLVGVFVLHLGGGKSGPAGGMLSEGQAPGVVRVMDSADYGRELRNASGDPGTVYILEQVSDSGTYSDIVY
jgi:hypothetical protein